MAYDNLIGALINSESGGNPNATNPNSSAGGAGQFIDSTWLSTVKTHRPDIAQGKTDAQLLQLKFDPSLSREMTAAYASDNANYLKSKGIEPTPGALKLAHFAGPGGAAAIYADPGATVEALLGSKAVAANPFLRGKTGSDAIAWADRTMSPDASMKTAIAQRYGGGATGDQNAPLAAPAQASVMSGGQGTATLAGGSGMDNLKSALSGYNADNLAQSDKLISDAQKLSGAGNWAAAIGGPVLAGIGGYQRDKELTAKKADDANTIAALTNGVNVPPVIAALLKSSNPDYKAAGMDALIKMQGPKAAPQTQVIKSRDPVSGREVDTTVAWNAQSGRYEPISMGGSQQPQSAPQAPASAQPTPMPASQPPQPVAPAVEPRMHVSPQQPVLSPQEVANYGQQPAVQPQAALDRPTPVQTQTIDPQTGQPMGAQPSQPPAPVQQAPQQPAASALPQNYFEGPAADKSIIGDGNIQQLSPGGRPLYQRLPDGSSVPVVTLKKSAETQAEAQQKETSSNREKAIGSIEYLQQADEARNLINTKGRVIGRYAQPTHETSGGNDSIGSVISNVALNPTELLAKVAKGLRDYASSGPNADPQVAAENSARDILEQRFTKLAQANLKSIYGSRVTNIDVQQNAKTVPHLTDQDAATSLEKLNAGTEQSWRTLQKGLSDGSVNYSDVPKRLMINGVMSGGLNPSEWKAKPPAEFFVASQQQQPSVANDTLPTSKPLDWQDLITGNNATQLLNYFSRTQ